MDTRCLIVLCGDSVFLAGIALNLKTHPTMEILTLAADGDDTVQRLAALRPDAIIYDLAHAPGDCIKSPSDWVLPLLSQCPGTRLIGLDTAADQALVISGQWSAAASLGDLAALIEQVAAPRAR